LALEDAWKSELRAAQVLQKLKISTLPVDPFEVATAHGIVCQEKPSLDPGVSGCLMKVGDVFGIIYSSRFASSGFKRFTVGHELGHYFLDRHVQALFASGNQLHTSESGFTSSNQCEREADQFAAALLMPEPLFRPLCAKAGEGLRAVESLAGLCGVSLTATAIRYALLTEDPVAVVCSEATRVKFCFMSNALREIRGLTWPKKGSGLPTRTATLSFNKDPKNVPFAMRVAATSTLDTWFDGGGDIELKEDVIGLGGYGRTLTILTATDLPEPEDPEDIEEEEALIESWTPRFRR
jgi:Zn-dependent peptidase ImmA (M78 family)